MAPACLRPAGEARLIRKGEPSGSAATRRRGREAVVGRTGHTLRPSVTHANIRSHALEQPQHRGGGAGPSAWLPRRRGGPSFRGARRGSHAFLRGPGQVDPQPGARGVADAVPVDHQSVQRMHPRVRLLPRTRNGDSAGRWSYQADRRSRARRTDLRHRCGGTVPTPEGHGRARQVVVDQAGIRRQTGGRHRADRQRGSPVSDMARVEVRTGQRARAPASPAPDCWLKAPRYRWIR